MARQQREAVLLLPHCSVQGLVAADQSAVEGIWVEVPTGSFRQTDFPGLEGNPRGPGPLAGG